MKKHSKKCSYPVIICAVNVPRHAKVSYFHQKAIPHKAVPGCQITVNEVLRCQVYHPSCNLAGYVKHLGKTKLSIGLQGLSIYQDHGVWPVGSEEEVGESVRSSGILHIKPFSEKHTKSIRDRLG